MICASIKQYLLTINSYVLNKKHPIINITPTIVKIDFNPIPTKNKMDPMKNNKVKKYTYYGKNRNS